MVRIVPIGRQHGLRAQDIHAVLKPEYDRTEEEKEERLPEHTETSSAIAVKRGDHRANRRCRHESDDGAAKKHHRHDRGRSEHHIVDQLRFVADQFDAQT